MDSGAADWTDTERQLARVWGEVLGRGPVDRLDDFFELSGTSIKVVEMLARVRATMGVQLGFKDVFRAPVLHELAAVIEGSVGGSGAGRFLPIGHHAPRDEYPLSSAQERLWFLEQLYPGMPASRTMTGVSFHGTLHLQALEAALGMIVARHGSLRASFRARDGVPLQVIRPASPVPLPLLDLRAHPDAMAEVQRLARAEIRAPMDLERDSLLRARLIRVENDRHVLLLTIHHIVFDAWSRNVLMRELAAFYRDAATAGEAGPGVAPLPFDYVDYAVWQRSPERAGVLEEERTYWKAHLGPDPLPLELPLDLPRPAVPGFEGLRETLRLPSSMRVQLKALAASEGTSIAILLLSAIQSLLHRHTESDSIVLGLVVAGRNHEGTGPLIGLFVNELALRVDVEPGETFAQLLARTDAAVRGAQAHQDLPLDDQVRTVRPARKIDQSPLFRVAYNFKPRRERGADFGEGLTWSSLPVDPGVAAFDLMVDVEGSGDELAIHLDFDRDLFRPATMKRLAGHLGHLLEGLVTAGSGLPVARLPLTGGPEREAILRASTGPWPEESAPDLIEQVRFQAARRAGHVAVEAPDGALTYAQLESETNRLARRLRSLGVRKESRVGVAVPRGSRELCALLATLKAGGAYVPVDPGHPVERVRVILEDAAPDVLVAPSDSPLLDAMPPGTRHLPLDVLEAATSGFDDSPLDEPIGSDQLAYILFTSGSTGRPKGVEVLRSGFANFLRSMAREPGMREDDRFLAVTTTTFDISGLELFGPLWVGGTAVVVDRQTSMDPRLLCTVLEREGVTILQATPATWGMLVGEGWKGTPGMRMLCGGEALSRDLADRLLERGSELWNLYGPTETTVWSTLDRVHPDGTPISIGRPVDRTRVCVLDEAGHLVPPRVVGEIFIGGDGVARGYRGRPDLTAERFLPDPFGAPGSRFYRTGDLGRLLDDGRFECLGRTDHQVKVRGFRIELGEVEAALRALAGVREVVVVATRSGTADPRLVAYWVGDATRHALQARALEALPPYMVPSAYARVEAFPLTTSGKVDRKALPRPDDSVAAEPTPAAVERPRNDTETRIASVWAQVLGVEVVGIDEDFFALGGTSLLAVQARSLLEREFGREIPLRAFFESPTVRSIATQVGAAIDPDEPIVAWLGRRPVGKPPLFCVLGVHLYQDLADALRGVQAVVGIHVPTRYRPGYSDSIRVEPIAAAYLTQIRAIQPRGPYHLAGFCFGGVVAYEIARQLEASGEQVAQVATFDGGLPSGFRRRGLSWLRERTIDLIRMFRARLGRRPDVADLDVTRPELRAAVRRYERTLGRIRARMLVVRAFHRELNDRTAAAPDLGWARRAGDMEVCVIPSVHMDLVRAPHSATVAARWTAGLPR
jgi:amino acid adenylation domain-containing protein